MKKYSLLFASLFTFGFVFAQSANTFLWRITNPANDSNSYLFGTIHLPQKRFMPLTDSVYDAVRNTAVFYNEINMMGVYEEMETIQAFGTLRQQQLDSIRKTPAWRRLVNAINQHYHQNLNPDSLEQFNQFGVEYLKSLYKPDPGVTMLDAELMGFAMLLMKPTKGLETALSQIKMLHKILDARLADSTLLFNADEKLSVDLADYYQRSRLDSIKTLIANINPLYRRIVFDDRNQTMADSIEKVVKKNTAFFAIGAGHLTGEAGLIAALQQRGFVVTPVLSDNRISITLMRELFTGTLNAVREKMDKEKKDDFIPPPPPPPLEPDEVKIIPRKKASAKAIRKTKN